MKTTIATVKNEFHQTEWSAQIQAQKSSGLTVHKWCEENGVNVNTVYLNFVPIISLLICFYSLPLIYSFSKYIHIYYLRSNGCLYP